MVNVGKKQDLSFSENPLDFIKRKRRMGEISLEHFLILGSLDGAWCGN